MFQKLQDITEASRKLGADTSKQLEDAHIQVRSIFEHHNAQREAQKNYMKKSFQAIAANQHEMQVILDKVELLSQRAAVTETTTEVLQSLQFPGMHDRHSNIHNRHQQTFSWIHNASAGPFKSWLEKGDGAFWISGKAGSGKSTLMKFIDNSSCTTELLQKWAGPRQLIVASFYFWNTGTEMQKSQEGLLQSILYKILRHEPELIPNVLPSRWRQDKLFHSNPPPWTLEELYAALDLLIQVKPKACFCIFIDGLDEYAADAGQQGEFAEHIMKLSESPNVKVCVASRPWIPFKGVFGQVETRMLTLESLTRDDMDTYVRDLLQKDAKFATLLKREPNAIELIREIRNKARGVFLWVVLVVKSLRSGLTLNDNLEELKRRLENLPASLKQFFRRMLDTIDDEYQIYACRMLYLARCAGPLPLRTFYWIQIESSKENYAIQAAIKQLDANKEHSETAKTILNKWTKDLLEVFYVGDGAGEDTNIAYYHIGFIHRTVGEFLAEPEIHEILHTKSGPGFDPNLSVCRVLLAEAKSIRCRGQRADLDDFLHMARRSICHAKQYEVQHQRGLTALLQELDSVISERLGGLFTAHWTASFSVTHPNKVASHRATVSNASSNFLAYAVASGLTEFVRQTLDAAPQEVRKGGRPLLDFAIYPTFPRHNQSQSTADAEYDVEMAELLLNRGALANQYAGGLGVMTIWQMFLLDISTSARIGRLLNKSRAWELARIFLTHGADRETEIPFTKAVEEINVPHNFGISTDREYERRYTRHAGVAECLAHAEQPQRVEDFLARLPEKPAASWAAWVPWAWWIK